MVWYLDSSALIKLVLLERETNALRDFIAGRQLSVSELAITEVVRGTGRAGGDTHAARLALQQLDLIPLTTAILEAAADLEPGLLRTLDAIHIASALVLGSECEGIVTYDTRMHEAARLNGFTIVAPGQSP